MADDTGRKEYDQLTGDDARLKNLAVFVINEDAKKTSKLFPSNTQASTFTEVYGKLKSVEEKTEFKRLVKEELMIREKAKRNEAEKIAGLMHADKMAEQQAEKDAMKGKSYGFPHCQPKLSPTEVGE